MYLKNLKRDIKASDETLQGLIDSMPIEELEEEESALVELKKIDPPIVNGIVLTEHPNAYQRVKYKRILDNGGIVCGLFVDNKLTLLLPTPNGGKSSSNIEDFNVDKDIYVKGKVSNRIKKETEDQFERVNQGRARRKRPKQLTPKDFWAQFTDNEITAINISTEAIVTSFVQSINNANVIPLKTKPIQNGITMLFVNNLISKKTHEELVEG